MSEAFPTLEEIERYHQESGANYGPQETPLSVVQWGLLKAACGWHNGSMTNLILRHHKLTEGYPHKPIKLTEMGRKYLWEFSAKPIKEAITLSNLEPMECQTHAKN